MLAAFTLFAFGFASVVTFALDHVMALTGLGLVGAIVVCVLLAIFAPAALPLLRTALNVVLRGLQWLIGTLAGRVVIAVVVAFLAGFWLHSALDRSSELRRELASQAAATEAAEAAAARRAEAAEADDAQDDEAAADLEDRFEALDRAAATAKAAPRTCRLTAAEAAEIDGVGAPRPTR